MTDTVTYRKIQALLAANKVNFKHYKHKPVYTSEQAMIARGDTTLHQGAKALVMQADRDFILYVLPADLKADIKKIKEISGVGKLAMASKDSVRAKTGLEVGSIPPFGSVIGLKTYVDTRLAENEEIVFNAARHDRSIKIKYEDYIKIEKPQVVDISLV